MTRKKPFRLLVFLHLLLLGACRESPKIDFHSYQELSEYSFISNGWFPEIVGDDARDIAETYDPNSNHLYGKCRSTNHHRTDSLFKAYPKISKDSIIAVMDKIDRPLCPDWFIEKDSINNNFQLVKHNGFYLIKNPTSALIYFIR